MYLIFYGSIKEGRVTVNGDGVRLTLVRNDDGKSWRASSDDALNTVRTAAVRELGEVFSFLLAGPLPIKGAS